MLYSLGPALVSLLFLSYGLYALFDKGVSRVTTSFFVLCITTFFWQATWAVLFQTHDPRLTLFLVKFGYLLILFLPTSLYHFLTEISERPHERQYVYFSYGLAAGLGVFLLGSDLFISGYYNYFWGAYPKAGPLHPIHLLQTGIVVMRGLYITYCQQQVARPDKRARLRLCVVSLFIYFFAAVDYLCNYGIEFYPPGVAFIAISLGIIAAAIVKYDLLNPITVAATVAHEMRTPLATIRMQAMALAKFWPSVYEGYQLAVQHGLCAPAAQPVVFEGLANLSNNITHEVDRSNAVIDMMLASATMEQLDKSTFKHHSIEHCITEAIKRYPFGTHERDKVKVSALEEFSFYGSDTLLTYVLFNLLKNALYVLKSIDKGEIEIATSCHPEGNRLRFTDTGPGIPADVLPHIFDAFFSTKKGKGTGIGLTFCHRVMTSFDGRIHCNSVKGHHTTFTLEFPLVR